MKSLVLSLAISMVAHNATASSAEISESCVAKTITGEELRIQHGGDASAAHYIDENGDIEDVEVKGSRFGGSSSDSVLVLKQIRESNVVSKDWSDDGYEFSSSTSTRVVTVENVKKAIATKYGLTRGMALFVVCYTSVVTPK